MVANGVPRPELTQQECIYGQLPRPWRFPWKGTMWTAGGGGADHPSKPQAAKQGSEGYDPPWCTRDLAYMDLTVGLVTTEIPTAPVGPAMCSFQGFFLNRMPGRGQAVLQPDQLAATPECDGRSASSCGDLDEAGTDPGSLVGLGDAYVHSVPMPTDGPREAATCKVYPKRAGYSEAVDSYKYQSDGALTPSFWITGCGEIPGWSARHCRLLDSTKLNEWTNYPNAPAVKLWNHWADIKPSERKKKDHSTTTTVQSDPGVVPATVPWPTTTTPSRRGNRGGRERRRRTRWGKEYEPLAGISLSASLIDPMV